MRLKSSGSLIVLAVVLAGCGSVSSQEGDAGSDATASIDAAPVEPDAGDACATKLVFQSAGDIFSVNPDGMEITNLTDGLGLNQQASWSPDGAKIAFISDRQGAPGVYVMNADGNTVTLVSQLDEDPTFVGWVPMSNQVSFVSRPVNLPPALVIVTDQGTGRQLVKDAVGLTSIPAWDPGGARVVYPEAALPFRLGIVDKSGANDQLLTPDGGVAPQWAPNASKVAYVGGENDIFTISPDGTANANLTSNSTEGSFQPFWLSNDLLAFVRDVDGTGEVLTMNADGTDQTNLTNSTTKESGISVAPDGSAIAFTRSFGLDGQRVGIVTADGASEVQIATPESAGLPRWRPCQ